MYYHRGTYHMHCVTEKPRDLHLLGGSVDYLN